MINKIFIYLFLIKIKYIFFNLLCISLFIQIINILEITKLIENNNANLLNLLYLSLLKLPSVIIETIPFVIIISTAFVYRYLISNNEIISMRNIGYSIIDIFKPIAIAIMFVGLLILFVLNPLSAQFEKKFDNITTKDFSNLYSIKIINDELWIKNIKDKNEKYFINISDIDLKNMNAKNIKIISLKDNNTNFYYAENGIIIDKIFEMKKVKILNIINDSYNERKSLEINLNFDKNNLLDSISNYKYIPFYKYTEHIKSLKKFNLYSPEIALYYLSEILKPLFLIIISFTVMGYSGRFKRNENFFKILFVSISIGFLLFMFKEVITAFSVSFNISFFVSYFLILLIPLIIGLYFVINIEGR